jgi:isoaspartyl peptidase/L-asparaginase-like protein (Ntn-hydrolase superfamily)
MSKKPNVVIVTWHDAAASTGWRTLPSHHKPMEAVTIGLVVFEDDKMLCLAGSWMDNEGDYETNSRMTIPKGWISSRRKVTLP